MASRDVDGSARESRMAVAGRFHPVEQILPVRELYECLYLGYPSASSEETGKNVPAMIKGRPQGNRITIVEPIFVRRSPFASQEYDPSRKC